MTIRSRLILVFAAVLLFPGIVLGFFSYETAKEQVQNQMMQAARGSVELLNDSITQYIQTEKHQVEKLTDTITSAQINNRDVAKIQEIGSIVTRYPEVQMVILGTENGTWIKAPDPGPQKYDPRTRGWYKAAMAKKGETVLSEPYIGATTGQPVMTISRTTPDGQGVVAIDLRLKKLADMIQKAQIGKRGYVYIVDSQKRYVVHPGAKAMTEAEEVKLAPDIFANDSGALKYTDQAGNELEAAYITNKETGWKLVGVMQTNEVTQAAQPIKWTTLTVIVLSLLVGGALVYIMVAPITKRLRELVHVSHRIREGDLTEVIPVHSRDELGQLGVSFNEMTASLRAMILHLNETSEQLAASSEQLTASTEETGKATEHIAETMQAMAGSSDRQIELVGEGVNTVHEMSAAARQITVNAQQVSNSADHASNLASEGRSAVNNAAAQMESIFTTVQELEQIVKNLGQRSREIGDIVAFITDIANQTNLLSLNAAIEAARAGEHGKGFAVVADEVRKLAEQTAQASQRIAGEIETIQRETKDAVQSMERGTAEAAEGMQIVAATGQSFEKIQEAIVGVTEQIGEVAQSARSIAQTTETCVEAMNGISGMTDRAVAAVQNVSASTEEQLASMQEIAASAAELSRMAEDMRQTIGAFKAS